MTTSAETEAPSTERPSNLPPYVPYKTFIGFIDSLRVGIPSHIDRSVMGSTSGSMQSWLLASLRAMNLIDSHGVPSHQLRTLVSADDEKRKHVLAGLFHVTYGFLSRAGIDLKTTTPSKVQAAFAELGAKGETVEKCIAFMKAMAKDAGVELSPYVIKRMSPRARSAVRAAIRRAVDDDGEVAAGDDNGDDSHESKAMKTVALPNAGGSLTLSGNFNPFELAGDERELVYDLIDRMKTYESKLA